MRVPGTPGRRRLLPGRVPGLAAPIQAVRVLDHAAVLGKQDPAVAHQPGETARGEGATAEAEEPQLIAGLVVLDQPGVAVPHVTREAVAERAAADPLAEPRAHAGLVLDELIVRLDDGILELADVRHRGPVRAVPGAVAEDDQAFAHGASLCRATAEVNRSEPLTTRSGAAAPSEPRSHRRAPRSSSASSTWRRRRNAGSASRTTTSQRQL